MTDQPIELIHTPNYQQIKQNFVEELTHASQGKSSSISFFKYNLPEKPLVTKGIIQGIVIGGTNYIVATEEIKSDGTRQILKKETGVLPLLATKKVFLNFISKQLDPRADAIGLNFGFPLKALTGTDGEIDGELARGTKEHAFAGLLHIPLGQIIKLLFEKQYHKNPFVSVANDTVCLTLAGDGSENGSFVAGTGFNMCLVLKDNDKKILVNLESGNFNKFTLSPILQKIDADSEVPGGQLFEKTISGKYLALYFNEKAKELNLKVSPLTTSQELSELSHQNHTDVAGDLARAIIERSAFFVAAAIAAAYEFCVSSRIISRGSTLELIGEGSLLWDGWHYQESLKKQLDSFGLSSNTIQIKRIQDSSINGAMGLLTNFNAA